MRVALHRNETVASTRLNVILHRLRALFAELRARGWHPGQLGYGDPSDDFVNGTDVDYDPTMADFDRRHHTDADEY